MEENKLHSEGNQELKNQLKLERDNELKEIEEVLISEEEKKTLINMIKIKYMKLLRESDDSLYLTN